MSFAKKGASAFGKLFIVIALAGTFIVGMIGVVYVSLQGNVMKVPEITGKDYAESEKELTAMGLQIKRRAERYSTEKPNTILEQSPKAGDTVKTGQKILVIISKANPEGEEAPTTIKKNVDVDDSEKIEELISDKPKKPKANTNTNTNSNKKKASTTRDVADDNSNSKSNSNANSNSADNKNSSDKNSNSADKANKNAATNTNKSVSNSNKSNVNANKTVAPKPAVSGGDVRPRRTPQP
ncbi:MAG: PASTA domain-containing protein [Acidobacteriota bacterium]|nr:PASTA domain-containing protein [Acidobacteriota bacterium]